MKKRVMSVALCFMILAVLCACQNAETEYVDPTEQARKDVINKWETAQGEVGTGKYIEDIYKQYPDDEVISNIYFYVTSKGQYDLYKSLELTRYLESAEDYANNIDPNYSGELSSEINAYIKMLDAELGKTEDNSEKQEAYEKASTSTDTYNSLTNSGKKKICNYIDERYAYYDSLEGGNSGDKYSDKIWQEAAEKFGLTESQISIIWMNKYSY